MCEKIDWYRDWHHHPWRLPVHVLALIAVLAGTLLVLTPSNNDSQAAVGINTQFPFQGRLTNSDGTVVADDDYDVTFRIYTVDTGGSEIWTEDHTGANNITTVDGIFNVMLGSLTSLSGIDFNQDEYWLGVTVESDDEMEPRIRLGAAPYAFNSDSIDGISSEEFFILNGQVGGQIAYGGTGSGDDLILRSTSDSTKGNIILVDDGGLVGIGTDDPIAKFAIQNFNTSTGLTGLDQISQDTAFAGVLLRSEYEEDTNMQGVMWTNSSADSYQNPIAGMWVYQGAGGSELRFGTSNDFNTGVNNFGLVVGSNGHVAVGSSTGTGAVFNVWAGGANYGNIDDLRTNSNNAGILIEAGAENDTYKPGIFWSIDQDGEDDFEYSRPVGGIWLYQEGTSTNMIFGTSNDGTFGITSSDMVLDYNGSLGIGGQAFSSSKLQATTNGEDTVYFLFNNDTAFGSTPTDLQISFDQDTSDFTTIRSTMGEGITFYGDADVNALTISRSSSYVGIGEIFPAEFFSVGSGSPFRIDAFGNIVRINNVDYSFPSFQGSSDQVLTNDGSGNLSWEDASGGGGGGGWTDDGATVRLSTATDSVGIGTASPQKRLDVRGDSVFYSNSSSFSEGINVFRTGASSAGEGINFHEGSAGTALSATTLSAYARIVPTAGHDDLVLGVYDGSTDRRGLTITNNAASVIAGNGALATNATDGFLYFPGMAGTPSGTPTSFTGRVPITYNTSDNTIRVYNGSWQSFGASTPSGWTDDGSVVRLTNAADSVSIGTASLGTPFNMTKDGSFTVGGLSINTTIQNAATTKGLHFGYSASEVMGVIGSSNSSSGLIFGTDNAGSYGERMRISSNGNVGIGNSSPATKLEVSNVGGGSQEVARFSNSSGNPYITIGNGQTSTTGAYLSWDDSGDNLAIGIHGADRLLTLDGDNVGIGLANSAPLYNLDVLDTTSTAQIRFASSTSNGGGYLLSTNAAQGIMMGGTSFDGGGWVARATGASTVGLNHHTSDGSITFTTNTGLTVGAGFTPTERLRITNAGEVRIANDAFYTARNQANNADINIWKLNTSNYIQWGQTGTNTTVYDYPSTSAQDVTFHNSNTSVANMHIEGYLSVYDTNGFGGIPSSGSIRIPNNKWYTARNDSNTGDINVLRVGSSNYIEWGQTSNNATTYNYPSTSAQTLSLINSNSGILNTHIEGYLGVYDTNNGGTTADAGVIRIPNDKYLYARNQSNTGNIQVIGLNTSNYIQFGQTQTNQTVFDYPSSSEQQVFLYNSGTSTANTNVEGYLRVFDTNDNGSDIANSGAIRLKNNKWITERNASNTGEINMIRVTTNNYLGFGDNNFDIVDAASDPANFNLRNSGATTANMSLEGVLRVYGSNNFGSTTADTGIIRIPNNEYLYGRNSSNTGNIQVIGVNANNYLQFGQTQNNQTVFDYPSSSEQHLYLYNSGTSTVNTNVEGYLRVFDTNDNGGGIAGTGAIRIKNNKWYVARNVSDTGDINVIKVNASDYIEFGPTQTNQTVFDYPSTSDQNLYIYNSSSAKASLNVEGHLKLYDSNNNSAPVASQGIMRLPNNTSIYARNASNTGDINLLGTNTSNQIVIGGDGSTTVFGGPVNVTNNTFTVRNMIPELDDTYDIGTSSLRWRDLYLGPTSLHIVSNGSETTTARDYKLAIQETDGSTEGNLRIMLSSTDLVNITPGGNVGVGMSTPNSKLTVRSGESGTVTVFTQDAGNAGLLISSDDNDSTYKGGIFWGTDSSLVDGDPSAGIWMYQDGSGLTSLLLGTSNADTGITNAGLQIDENGRVAIGNSGSVVNPVTNLEVRAGQSATLTDFTQDAALSGLLIRTGASSNTYKGGIFWGTDSSLGDNDPTGGIWMFQDTSGFTNMVFGTSNADTGITNTSMIIDKNSNVGIGLSTPLSDLSLNYKAFVRGSAGTPYTFGTDNPASGNADGFIYMNPAQTGGISLGVEADTNSNFLWAGLNTSESVTSTIDGNGNIFGAGNASVNGSMTSTSFIDPGVTVVANAASLCYNTATGEFGACVSDARLKENINYSNIKGLEIIEQLKPASFDYINGTKAHTGFIAQDVKSVVPNAVVKTADGYLALNSNELIPFAVKGIQELMQQVKKIQVEKLEMPKDIDIVKVKTETLVITKLAQIEGELTVAKTVTLEDNLIVAGHAEFKDSITVAKTLTVKEDLELEGKILGSKEIRNFNLSVESGAIYFEVKDLELLSEEYAVVITPNWQTDTWVTQKTETGFKVNFGTPAPEQASFDYVIIK